MEMEGWERVQLPLMADLVLECTAGLMAHITHMLMPSDKGARTRHLYEYWHAEHDTGPTKTSAEHRGCPAVRPHLVLGVGVVLESDDNRKGAGLEATVPDGLDADLQGMGCRGRGLS